MASILKVDTIQDQSGNNIINENADTITIGASGDTITVPTGASLTVPNGGLTGQNYPAFEATLTANQGSVSNNAYTKVNLDSEIYDTDGCYDNTTNYRFTPTVAGKYFAYTSISANRTSGGNGYLSKLQGAIKKNGSFVKILGNELNTSIINNAQIYHGYIFEMNGSTDYLELFARLQGDSGTIGQFQSTTLLGAFRLGA